MGASNEIGGRGRFFPYAGELDAAVMSEIERTFGLAVKYYRIAEPDVGKSIAAQLQDIVDGILKTGRFPAEYADLPDATVALGVLFGQALRIGYGWKWMGLGSDPESSVYSVVSPERHYSNAPLHYLNRIISGKNIGPDGRNDNTVLLLYNMLDGVDKTPRSLDYFPLQ